MTLQQAPTLGELETAAETARAVMAEMGNAPPSEEKAGGDEVGAGSPGTGAEAAQPSTPKQRDEKGRFAAKQAEEPGREDDASKKPAAAEGAAPGATEPPAKPEDEAPPLEPPAAWSAPEHAAFRKLPREAQQFVLDRVGAAAKAAEDASQASGRYKAVEDILAPRRQFFARDGLDDAGALRQLFALSDAAGRDPVGFARWFISQRGIQPDQLWPSEDDGAAANVDPNLASLMQRLDRIESYLQTQTKSAEEQAQQQVRAELQRFADAKDDKGAPKHPYYEQVKALMGALMGSGRAPDLDTAYDMACRADPDVSAKIASARQAQEERERARQQREKAAAAGKAGSSISGTPADRAPPEDTGDPREDMRRMFVEQGLIA